MTKSLITVKTMNFNIIPLLPCLYYQAVKGKNSKTPSIVNQGRNVKKTQGIAIIENTRDMGAYVRIYSPTSLKILRF